MAFLLVSTAQSRDWIVNPETGADSNDGTPSAPLATAQAAVDRAELGDRVVLHPAGAVYLQSIDLSKASTGLVLDGNGVTLDGGGKREAGLVANGSNRNVKVLNLSAKNHRHYGFLVGGDSRGFQFFGISSTNSGNAEFAVRDRAECWIQGGNFASKPDGRSFLSQDAAESYHTGGRFEGMVLLEGGRHSLSNCTLVENPAYGLLSIHGSPPDSDAGDGVATLVIQGLAFEDNNGVQPYIDIGPGSHVYHDAVSKEILAKFEVTIHPSSELRESLYRTFPIGRSDAGAPLMAWAGGGARQFPSTAYRVIHFGKHIPEEVAPKAAPDNDWFGLLAPLDTTEFPPAGKAFEPGHASAHAIWRWIGLVAPDAVFVPDSPEGLALGRALQTEPPAGVGTVNVFLSKDGGEGGVESVVMPLEQTGVPTAKEEMRARIARTPAEVLATLADHHGDRFSGSYIEALAIMARAEGGLPHRSAELAREFLDKSPALPINGGAIAGTLLHATVDEPWAKGRVLAVADMAFDAEGKPLDAMPTHNEMSDAVFMASPILAEAGRISGKDRYFEQALRNFRFIAGLCRRADGIYRHSPLDEAAWGRGNGFPALGLALTLRHFPKEREGYAEMVDALRAHLAALAPHQDSDGMWHQVIDHPDSYAELTATCMIAYAIAVALDEGWIEEDGWRSRLDAAWSSVKMHVSTDGRMLMNVCTGTGKQKTLEDYYLREAILGPDGRGAAMVMMLAAKLKGAIRRSEPLAGLCRTGSNHGLTILPSPIQCPQL